MSEAKRSCIDLQTDPLRTAPPSLRKMARLLSAEGYQHGLTGTVGVTSAYQMAEKDRLIALARFSKVRHDELTAELEDLDKQLADSYKKRRALDWLKELQSLFAAPFRLSKVEHSFVRSALSSALSGNVIYFNGEASQSEPHLTRDQWFEIAGTAQAFLVEHDWGEAFRNSDLTNGDIRVPYDVAVFEFIVNNFHICYLKSEVHRDCLLVRTKNGWAALGAETDDENSLPYFLAIHVRCICIMLDAEVAHSEVVREPSNGVSSLSVSKLGNIVYRVIRLNNRRALPSIDGSTNTGRKVRLHWRRGHWRHFSTHKTWINWMLVGDPDLGFVDKEYRL